MLPLLPRVHHLKLSPQGTFREELSQTAALSSRAEWLLRKAKQPRSRKTCYPAENYRSHRNYFTSTVAPASANFFLMVSASSLLTPSLMVFGAPSTRSLASFSPKLVTSRTALITLILFAPTAVRMTANSVFSSAGAAPAAAPPPATIIGAAAAADTPSRSSSFFTKAAASSSDRPTICSSNCCRSAICLVSSNFWSISSVNRKPGFQCVQAHFAVPDNTTVRTAQPPFLISIRANVVTGDSPASSKCQQNLLNPKKCAARAARGHTALGFLELVLLHALVDDHRQVFAYGVHYPD